MKFYQFLFLLPIYYIYHIFPYQQYVLISLKQNNVPLISFRGFWEISWLFFTPKKGPCERFCDYISYLINSRNNYKKSLFFFLSTNHLIQIGPVRKIYILRLCIWNWNECVLCVVLQSLVCQHIWMLFMQVIHFLIESDPANHYKFILFSSIQFYSEILL